MNLKPCPCGRTPETLYIEVLSLSNNGEGAPVGYRALLRPSCCEEWIVEHLAVNGQSIASIVEESWNAAPRGEK